MSLPTPDRHDLTRLGEELNLALDDEEIAALEALVPALSASVAALGDQDSRQPRPGGRVVGERPDRHADPYNAIVRRCSVRARDSGRLAGKRVGVKDTVSIAGIPLSCGSRLLGDYTPRRDATIVRRLLDEGAEITAVLNMDDMALSGTGDTSAFGPVLNPHDPRYLAGGSSGGSAAALFYDDVDLTLGGDQGGSIRIPSSFCGTVGLKPTHGLVPYTGVVGADASIDHVGPMARSVDDVALLLEVIAGPDGLDPRQRGARVEPYRAVAAGDPSGLRIALLTEGFDPTSVAPDVASTVREAALRLRDVGASVEDVSLPAHRGAGVLLLAVLCEGFERLLEGNAVAYHQTGPQDLELLEAVDRGRRGRASNLSLMAKLSLVFGRHMRQAGGGRIYARAQNARLALRTAYEQGFERFDLLVMPTTPTTALPNRPEQSRLERLVAGSNVADNTAPFDLTGHPAISLPCGKLSGLPVGLMLVGRHFEDGTVLRAARALERMLADANA
jgi:amidase